MRVIFASILFYLLSNQAFSQSYKFKKFQEKEGLNNRFIYFIDQDENGFLIIGTGEGLYRFDGFNFKSYMKSDGLGDDVISTGHKTKDGSLWLGHLNGTISKFKNGRASFESLQGINSSRINDIQEDKGGAIWALSQNGGLLKRMGDNNWQAISKGIEDLNIFCFAFDDNNAIWLGTDMGLLKAQIIGDAISYEYIEEISESSVTCLLKKNNMLLVGTDHGGLFRIEQTNGQHIIRKVESEKIDFDQVAINNLYEDFEKNIWISSNDHGLLQLSLPVDGRYLRLIDYTVNDQLQCRSIRTSFRDREGNVWIGSTGEGLIKLVDNYFAMFDIASSNPDNTIYCVYERNDTIWSGGKGKVYVSFEHANNIIFEYNEKNGIPDYPITSISNDINNNIWIGVEQFGLFKLKQGSNQFASFIIPGLQKDLRVNDILPSKECIFVATDDGIFQLKNEKLVYELSTESGLAHNAVKSLFKDSKGRIWIATHNNEFTFIEDGMLKNLPTPFSGVLLEVKCITEDNDGNIWMGTSGSGVFKVSNNEITAYNKGSGLHSDYCYSLICDNKNMLWIGHHGAISQINLKNGEVKIYEPGFDFSLDFSDNAADKLTNGTLIFGTTKGILRYEPEKDLKNEIEPILSITQINISDSIYNCASEIKLKYGNYKLEVNFVGVSLRNPENVQYQFILEGYDSEWCDLTSANFARFNKLGPGVYKFRVKSFNSDGFGGTAIQEFKIVISEPFWSQWWFIVICSISTLLSARYVVLRRERFLKANQEYLKNELTDRTKEVVEQKELLESKNKDITDSIVYAKNIQNAMLPQHDSLNKFFRDSFVYFKPRDIVSGDFYWVEKFGSKTLVACADCTGHGVPGAFMSLIGTSILKEVARKQSINSPSAALVELDLQLHEMLNKQTETTKIEDGMDICILEYDSDTRMVKIASANRPVIIYIKGGWKEIKGERQSIGGSIKTQNKEFEQHEFYVSPGDTFYLFSDGITDQFGGPEGKKLKRSGFLKWIQKYNYLPLNEQRKMIRDEFYKWKGNTAQLDDIIIIGLRF
jgi:ligand-binding sensor domain-containing protein/serine phosphatase RsbU (regulator of sigma subunit)